TNIKAICSSRAKIRRSCDIGFRFGSTNKCRPYLLAFISAKHPSATASFCQISRASPTGNDFEFFDADGVGSTAFEQPSSRAHVLARVWKQATAFVPVRNLSRKRCVQFSRLCEDCQRRSCPDTLDDALPALLVFCHSGIFVAQ